MNRKLLPPLLFVLGAVIFFSLRRFGLPGGDTIVIDSPHWFGMLWGNQFVYYLREPLSHMVVHRLYLLIGDLHLSFFIVGAISGGLWLALLAWFCPKPAFLLINFCTILIWEFVGHVEFYAPFVVVLTLYFILLVRALEPEPRARPVQVLAVFALGYMFHKMMLFFLPTLFWLAVTRRESRWERRPWPRGQWEAGLIILILAFVLDMVPGILSQYPIGGLTCGYVPLNERFIDLITPLTPAMARYFEKSSITGMFYLYTFGTRKHWAFFFGFLMMGAPLGVPVLLWQLRRWRQALAADGARALATAVVIAVGWIFWWHPRGEWGDWDLFGLAGVPINLLAGLLAVSGFRFPVSGKIPEHEHERERETPEGVTPNNPQSAIRNPQSPIPGPRIP